LRAIKIFICLFLILSVSVEAQRLSGQITDYDEDFGIENAELIIIDFTHSRIDTIFTDSNGNWEFQLITNVNDQSIPDDFNLLQNYPNPFNPSTKINFIINKPDNITMTIHNILGELVDSKSAFLNSGKYSIEWEGKGSAGIYFYTIQSSSKSITKKMVQLDGLKGKGFGEINSMNNSSLKLNRNSFTQSSTSLSIIINKFGYVSDTLDLIIESEQTINQKMRTIHSNSILVDLHNDILEIMLEDKNYHLSDMHNYNHTDIPRLQKGKVDMQFFAVWVNPTSYTTNAFAKANEMIDLFESEIFASADKIQKAVNSEDINSNVKEEKISGVIGVEGGHAIENDLNKLIALYNRGMRYLTITWNNSTDWAVSASDNRSTTIGLSEFGKKVIRTMDSLGVIIDVSHTGIQTIKDILAITKNPIIATHSGVRALQNHTRNLYDYQIKDIANSGGVIGIVFYPPFLGSPNSSVDIQTVIKHIDYIVNLVGVDYVAIGSDFDGIGTNTVNGLEDVTKFPDLTMELLKHGYSRNDIEKILGGNFLRVFKSVVR